MLRLACLFALLATPSLAFTARNDLVVQPGAEGAFFVPYRGLSGAPDFWCAASDYVVNGLHRPASTRIYRTSPLPRPAGQGIGFSLSAAASIGKTGLIPLGPDDGSLSAAMALALCDTGRDRDSDS